MLLHSLDVKNVQGSVLNLPLDNSSAFKILNIDGLDPVEAVLSSSSFANMDGEQYYSARRGPRDIKIRIGIRPNMAVVDVQPLRSELYNYFMPKSKVDFTFNMVNRFSTSVTGSKQALVISGRVQAFETALFTQDPAVDITIRCFDPNFVDPREIVFSNVSTNAALDTVIYYGANQETGFIFEFLPDRNLSEFTIFNWTPDGNYRNLDFTYPMQFADIITISTVVGNKYATVNRGGVETPILYAISPQSAWVDLQPGDNRFRIRAAGNPIPYRIKYTYKYGGL